MSLPLDSPILITGAAGFIGRNLVARLHALGHTSLLLYDADSSEDQLAAYARQASFVFHLAGINRPKDAGEFYTGNSDLTTRLIALLEEAGNPAPVVLSSSAQAGNGSDYAKSKEAAEAAVHAHGKKTGARVFVYRLPGVFGKWSRPNYNTVVATFCHNIARDLPIEIRDETHMLNLCYIDDVVDSFLANMDRNAASPPPGGTLGIIPSYNITLGGLAAMLRRFKESRHTLAVPDMTGGLEKKMYSTWLAYLPEDDFAYPLKANRDERGSFTEVLRTPDRGQVSVNVAKPGITKGNHWHDSKNEKFLVVSGEAVIRFRKIGCEEIIEYRVNGEEPIVVDIPTGYTHNIENVGKTDLVTVMWANEAFDPDRPDTWFETV